jgi:hypothetical protein
MTDTAIRRRAELRLLATDVCWAWRIASDIVCENNEAFAIPTLCVMPHLSLVIHESQNYLGVHIPSLAQALALNYGDVVEQARHRLKLFDDTRLGLQGVAEYFSEGLVPAHRRTFVDPVRLPLAACWKADLGVFSYDRYQIGTTHTLHFNLGTDPDFLRGPQQRVQTLGRGEAMGRYLARLAEGAQPLYPQLDWEAPSFIRALDCTTLRSRDTRAVQYYKTLFGGRLPLGVLAALDTVRAWLRVLTVLTSGDSSAGAEETLLKLRFVTLYHVLSGLNEVGATYASILDPTIVNVLTDIGQHPTTDLLTSQSSRRLRNTLVHYGLDSRCPTTAINPDLPVAGLVEFYFPAAGFTGLAATLQSHCEYVAGQLDNWAGINA